MFLHEDEECHVIHGDCITEMVKMPDGCVDFSIFSPPFPAVYSYQSSPADIGNSEDLKSESKLHLSFFYRQIRRVMKPGRAMIVHVMQIVRMKRQHKEGGMFDFRGLNIRIAERAGLIYDYDWLVRRNPQAQSIRTKSRALAFAGLESDRAGSRGAMCDYLIKFRAPGENIVPIRDAEIEADEEGEKTAKSFVPTQVSRDEWIDWAEGYWTGIKETDTLNVAEARSPEDEKHICCLQLGIIERCVRLFSNPGEIVFSPFAGIGSEGYVSLLHNRRFFGIELKKEYHSTCLRNLERAIKKRVSKSKDLFSGV